MWNSLIGTLYDTNSNVVAFSSTPAFGESLNASLRLYFHGRVAYLAITNQVQTPEAREAMLSYLSNRFEIALV